MSGPDLPLQAAGRTEAGSAREGNEDAILVQAGAAPHVAAHGALLAVADGMGGHAAGEVASQLAVDTLRTEFYLQRGLSARDALKRAFESANAAILASARDHPEQTGMGCTLTAAVIYGQQLVIGHVGDSRAYLVRQGEIRQLTTDHSWVGEQVAAGKLTPEQARNHPQRNVIRRALGFDERVEVDVLTSTLEPGDAVVLCSDGLTVVVDDREIAPVVIASPPEEAVGQLIDLANTRGSPDNVSVVVGRIRSGVGGVPAAAVASRSIPRLAIPAVIGAIVLIGLLAAAAVRARDSAPQTVLVTPPAVALAALPTPTSVEQRIVAPTAAPTATAPVTAPIAARPTVSPTTSVRPARVSDRDNGANLRASAARSGEPVVLAWDTSVRIISEEIGESVEGSTRWYHVEVLDGPSKGRIGYVHASALEVSGP